MITEYEILTTIQNEVKFPPLEWTLRTDVSWDGIGERQRPDLLLTAQWDGVRRDFAAECKSRGGLSGLRSAILQAKSIAYANRSREFYPLVIVPYLNAVALDELIVEKTSGLDLCGNGVVYVPGTWIVYRTGARNLYPDSAPVKTPYRGEQSLVTRALLAKAPFQTQQQIVEYLRPFGVAPSTVSKVLTALETDLAIVKKPQIDVTRRNAILDRLRESFSPPKTRSQKRLRVPLDESTTMRMRENAERMNVMYAENSPERYAVFPSSSSVRKIITSDSAALMDGILAPLDERFATVELTETTSKVPFFNRTFEEGMWWISPLEVYLELANGGKRERETAATIRARYLDLSTES